MKQTVLLSRLTYRKEGFVPPPQSPVAIKRQKNIRNIMGTIFITVIRHLENVNRIPWRKVNEKVRLASKLNYLTVYKRYERNDFPGGIS